MKTMVRWSGIAYRLDDRAIGRTVYYIPSHAKDDPTKWERGRIARFNNERRIAWVVYDKGDDAMIDHYEDYTAACTDYADLRFKRYVPAK